MSTRVYFTSARFTLVKDGVQTAKLCPDTSEWKWPKLHRQTFVHNLVRTSPYNEVFNILVVEIGGDASIMFNAGVRYDRDFAVLAGLSLGMIIDFADPDKSVWMLPPGQSGHPGSPHYADGIEPWLDVEYRPMIWNWKRVKASQEGTLWWLRGATKLMYNICPKRNTLYTLLLNSSFFILLIIFR
jgi:acyl-homoserine lactone acylase PvdQ